MKDVEVEGESSNKVEAALKKITNVFLLAVCVLMLFSVSWILFDKGAVMVAQDVVNLNSPVLK